MAVLSAEDRRRAVCQYMREWRETPDIVKLDLHDSFDTIDAELDKTITTLQDKLSAAYKAKFTADHVASVACYILLRRLGKLRTEEDTKAASVIKSGEGGG